jgi:hypothetical protein
MRLTIIDKLRKLRNTINDPDFFPIDDKDIERWHVRVLNRIDNGAELGCSFILSLDVDGIQYCEAPEHNPFTDRCRYHDGMD